MASLLESDNSNAALELLKPDPPLEVQNDANEEEDLEALRMAALASMRPKKTAFKVQAHPVRSNLLSIVPVEDDKVELPKESFVVKPFKAKSEAPLVRSSGSPAKNKFSRFDSDRSSEESESEEEIEVEEEVTATESEGEEKAEEKPSEKKPSQLKTQLSEPDDVLNVDCSEEVDEFTNFLNEFEDELKEPKKPAVKPKKTKIIIVKKKVKKSRPAPKSDNDKHGKVVNRDRSRTPPRYRRTPPRRYSPRSRYSPPPYRRGSRSPSPFRRRRSPFPRKYSRSPSPRRYRHPRPHSRSPHRRSPPNRSKRTPTLSPEPRVARGGSAPRQGRDFPSHNQKKDVRIEDKSKSLPPPRNDESNAKASKVSEEEKALKAAEDKLKSLPSPERERLLQRRKKFESNMIVQPEAKKISLKKSLIGVDSKTDDNGAANRSSAKTHAKKRKNSEDNGDSITLSVDDTLDMFDEDKPRRQGKKRSYLSAIES